MMPEEISREFNVSAEDVGTIIAYAEQVRRRGAHRTFLNAKFRS